MATWPATLPIPNVNGFQLNPMDPVRRTQMEVGASRKRRISKSRDDRVNVEWTFTDAQMAIFRTWFDDDAEAAGGSAWFSMDLYIGESGITTQEACFNGIWKSSLLGGVNWVVTATLEVR